jgi:hypothetical protein
MLSRKKSCTNLNTRITSPEQSDTKREFENKRKYTTGGCPKDPVWNYFTCINIKHSGHYSATCKNCNYNFKMGSVNKLQIHLTCNCKHVEEEVKVKYMHIFAEKDGLDDDSLEVKVFQANTSQGKLTSFWDKDKELPAECIALIDRSILKAFVIYGLTFHIVKNPYFVNMIKNLRSTYNPPLREILTTKLLPEEAIRVELKIKNILQKSDNLTLSIKFLLLYYLIFNYYLFNNL